MLKTRTFTLVTSTILAETVDYKDDKIVSTPLEPIVIDGKITIDRALSKVRGTYGRNKSYIVKKIEITEEKYTVNVDDLLKIANKQ